ncbi:MAG TPA: zinc-binding alcohol dehydrogenase [Chloroflexota bacterium]|nr:zinc-binding alcohol dehydrogenase [Chloroflexota bacterium]
MIKGRQVVFTGTRQAEWQEFELPEQLGPDEVLIKTLWSAISAGTETAIYGGTHIGFRTPGARYPKYPYLAGYAATGEILAVGSAVPGLRPGQVVTFPGKHATHGIWNARSTPLTVVPQSVPPDLAALTRLGTISLNGIRLARIGLGDTVAVFGAGLIGQFAAQFAQLAGGFPVVSIDRLPGRLAQATACGIPQVIDASEADAVEAGKALTKGRGFDVVVEGTGAGPVVAQALSLAAVYGKVLLLGSPRGRVEIDPYHTIHSPGVTVIGAHMRTTPGVESVASHWTEPANAQLIVDLLAAEKLVVGPLISHRLPAAEAIAAYEGIITRPEDYLGVLLDWREG